MPADQAYLRKCIEDTKGSFPDKLKHQLAQIKSHDVKVADLQTKIDAMSRKKLLLAAKQGGKAERAPKRRHTEDEDFEDDSTHGIDDKFIQTHGSHDQFLEWALKEVEKLSDEKFKMATELYDLVDGHIQRLDKDMEDLEADLHKDWDALGICVGANAQEALNVLDTEGKAGFDAWMSKEREKQLLQQQQQAGQQPPKKGRGGRRSKAADLDAAATQVAADRLPLPPLDQQPPEAGPDEPRYCTCQRGSWGLMVSCDNDNCPTEWFHYQCVGLTEAPEESEKWYCPNCRDQFEGKGRGKGAAGGAAVAAAAPAAVTRKASGRGRGRRV